MWLVPIVVFVSNTVTFIAGWVCGWVGASSSQHGLRGPVLLITLGVFASLVPILALIALSSLGQLGRNS